MQSLEENCHVVRIHTSYGDVFHHTRSLYLEELEEALTKFDIPDTLQVLIMSFVQVRNPTKVHVLGGILFLLGEGSVVVLGERERWGCKEVGRFKFTIVFHVCVYVSVLV